MDEHLHAAASTAGDGFWSDFLSASFMPHGCCYQWQPVVLWSHVVSDALIALSYYSIPVILFAFISKRRDVPFNAIFFIFGIFILACGTTHVIEIISVWDPIYRTAALVKIITALVSMIAVIMLIPVMPKALALPSLRTANEQLQRTTHELRRSNQELEEFAYVASHDLQEPLRMITMYLDLLQRKEGAKLSTDGQEYITTATKGAERMRTLISELLAYARIERIDAGQMVIDSGEALDEALGNLKPAILARGTHVTRGALPQVRADRGQLVQVFQNLVGNAIKFGTTDEPWTHVSAERKGGEWIFSVQDNGIGIDPQHQKRIFDVFQRLHPRDAYPGTGIGLSVAKKIVERHGGRIWVESQPGVGSIFHFSLPALASA
jgi:two-component system, chemotaxis family, sensor kinase Cph1